MIAIPASELTKQRCSEDIWCCGYRSSHVARTFSASSWPDLHALADWAVGLCYRRNICRILSIHGESFLNIIHLPLSVLPIGLIHLLGLIRPWAFVTVRMFVLFYPFMVRLQTFFISPFMLPARLIHMPRLIGPYSFIAIRTFCGLAIQCFQ